MANPFQIIADKGIVPVINIEKTEWAVPLAAALMEGGLPLIEVTLRSETSLQSIAAIRKAYPAMAIAAGTVLSPEQAQEALDAGADMIVAPGYQPKTVTYCAERGVAVLPGCVTASDIQQAVDAGLHHLKFFPSEQCGGIKAIELLCGPFKSVDFVPTGGITFDNLQSYLSSPKVLACGGSFMAKADWLRREDWAAVTAACRRAMDISLGFRLAHVGINHENDAQAMEDAKRLCRLFRLPMEEHNKSVFSGAYVENMRYPFYGAKGHIGFKTNSLPRALAYLAEGGVEVLEESKQYKNGKLTCVYLKDEIGGFAIHLI